MQNGDGRFLPRDQTTASFRPFIAGIGLIPCLSDLRHVLCVNAVHTEDQIAALEDFLPFRGQRGVFFGALWIPAGKEPQNGLCHGMGDLCQKFPVLFGASHEALQRTFRLSLIIAAENVTGIITQEIWDNANCPFNRYRQFDQLRSLFSLFIGQFQRPQALDLTFRGQFQSPADLDHGPARLFQLAGGGQRFITAYQCLQDHLTTSQSRRSIMPLTIRARKNMG